MMAIHELTLGQCQVDIAKVAPKPSPAQESSWAHLGMPCDYVVQGVIAEFPEPRLHLLLIKANTGRTLFSETSHLLSMALEQDLERTMTFMRNKLMSHEIHLFHRMKFKAKGAFHYLLLAEECLKHFSQNSIEDAIRNLCTALDFDPDYVRVYATLSKTYCIAWRFEWDVANRNPLDEAIEMSARSMELDSHDPAAPAAQRLGQDAAPYAARVLQDQPHFSVRRRMAIQPLDNPDEAADYADSLIAAGLPN